MQPNFTEKLSLEEASKLVNQIFKNVEGYEVMNSMGSTKGSNYYQYQILLKPKTEGK